MGSIHKFSVDCQQCPRLSSFLAKNRQKFSSYYNLPVPSCGSVFSRLLIVGLAPGLHGANKTGQPFTGDHSGVLLHQTLLDSGFTHKDVSVLGDSSVDFIEVRITNAVRCVPPLNRPVASEVNNCQKFLVQEIKGLIKNSVILALGTIAHGSVIRGLGLKLTDYKFRHGKVHDVGRDLRLWDSYHCSRYNLKTGRLTEQMFKEVFQEIKDYLSKMDNI